MTSTATIDPAAESFEAELDALPELVAAELNLRRLTAQVMRITRQVNALERVVIPRLVAEQRHIAATLEQRALEDRARVSRRAGRHPRSQWFPRCAGPRRMSGGDGHENVPRRWP
jgi:V/A-type H+/Na+-transporting ATPase subunit D